MLVNELFMLIWFLWTTTAFSGSQKDSILRWWCCSTTWHIFFVGRRS